MTGVIPTVEEGEHLVPRAALEALLANPVQVS
jgi:hypothetical protein